VEELANTRQARPYLQVRSPADGVVLSRNLTLYQWFKAGEEFYDIADIGRVWVYADVYEDEVMHIRPGMDVKVRHEQMGKTFDARVSQVLPLFDPVAKTLKVRLDVDNTHYDLRPDMFVDVEIPITMPPSLHLPADAVLDSGTRKIIYVDIGNGIFEPRGVETGWRLGRRIEITDGLMPGEKILISGNFLIDSESRMKTAGAGIYSATRKDLVCGMSVDEEKAKISGNTATYANRTFYFCMDQCKEEFEQHPEKYVGNERTDTKHETHAAMPKMNRSWVDMLQPVKGSHVMKKSGTYPGQKMGRTIGTPGSSPDIVDWDGDKPPSEWRRGWGGFPGAKYLGIKDKTKTSQPSNPPEAGGQSTAEGERGGPETAPKPDAHKMNHQTHQRPASDPLPPSAK
jgi:YHS domain-containing protein